MPDSGEVHDPRVVLHVGLPKTGTTFVQGLLAENRDRLRFGGVLYPFLRPGAMFRGAVEIRGSHAKFGLSADEVAGSWVALCDRARDFAGTTILSHEVLAGATPDEVADALAPLDGLEVHVVVTARDLGRQATAHWQEEVKLGATFSFAEFERDQLRADTGPDDGPDAGGVRPHFWHAQDFADCLRRWSVGLPAGRAHLVVGPPPGAPADELWRRFADAAGIDAGLVDAAAAPPANPSLAAADVALLRAVNAQLETQLDGRLDAGAYNRIVKRAYAEGVLAPRPGARPRTPYDLREVLAAATDRWVADVVAAGHRVHGDVADLTPVLAGPGDPAPDQIQLVDDPARIASTLIAQVTAEPADRPSGEPRRDPVARRRWWSGPDRRRD